MEANASQSWGQRSVWVSQPLSANVQCHNTKNVETSKTGNCSFTRQIMRLHCPNLEKWNYFFCPLMYHFNSVAGFYWRLSCQASYLRLWAFSWSASGRCSECPEEHRAAQNSEEPKRQAGSLGRRQVKIKSCKRSSCLTCLRLPTLLVRSLHWSIFSLFFSEILIFTNFYSHTGCAGVEEHSHADAAVLSSASGVTWCCTTAPFFLSVGQLLVFVTGHLKRLTPPFALTLTVIIE